MSLIIGLLSGVLVLDCLLLMLLILMQLPKKEAGAGLAFGGGAGDALFGAGAGNALTKITKYAAGLFLGMAMLLSILNSKHIKETNSGIEKELQKATQQSTPIVPPGASTPIKVEPANGSDNPAAGGAPLQLTTPPAKEEAPSQDSSQAVEPAPASESATPPAGETPAPVSTETPAPVTTEAPAPQTGN